jgi:hypothetical protein
MLSLRTTLLADSVVCFIYGAVLVIAADSLSTLFTTNPVSLLSYSLPQALRIVGWSVLGTGLYVCTVGCAKHIVPIAVWLVIGIEIAWIVGSILLLIWIGNSLSWVGIAFIISGTVAVFGFMLLELIGLQSLYKQQG